MKTIVEVAFQGKMADEAVKKMGRHFAKDNRGLSIRELRVKLGESESSILHAIIRLKDDMEVMEDKMNYSDIVVVGGKKRVENTFKIKDEYMPELKAIFLRQ
ncbi:MAG: hypothetical protein KGH58_02430 [Candidatus Micrarchaeota archaeon]|nr:hypothetical protein [Candidatus Micrarchaeota archaeon]